MQMYNNDADFIFPSWVIKALKDQKGDQWKDLVESIPVEDINSTEHLAFVYLMAKLNNCQTCNADSFRALKGCKECSLQTMRRSDFSDSKLMKEYEKSFKQIDSFIKTTEKKDRDNE
jgi:hypothetical protein